MTVAWPSAVDLAKIIDQMAFTGPDASKVGRQATAIKKANYIRRLYATPPVRGDLESELYAVLIKYLPQDATLDNLYQELKEAIK